MVVSRKDDRRKHSRVGFTTAIKVALEAGGEKINFDGNSNDLSLKGIFVTTQNSFSSGTKCSIRICLTGGIDKIELMIKGTVVRNSSNGMGIEFDSMDIDTYSHLKNIVYYNSVDE